MKKKEKITYIILLTLNIILIIYCANKNCANYASVLGEKIFVGNTKDLLLGKNNIVLIITLFFIIYINLIKKFIFKHKINKKNLIINTFIIFILNCIIFYIFTRKIY